MNVGEVYLLYFFFPTDTVPSGVVDYYLVCNETCVSSPFQEAYNNASEAFDVIPLAEEAVRDYINGSMPDLLVSD